MQGSEFKRLARQGVKSYGDDPWFFLRELAQNSRDAGARRIHVSASTDGGREVLVFSDDGRGMDRAHAEQFLFRLYASSKESERSSAGMYGIGFWTVLGFEPDRIEVASHAGAESWALRLDGDLSVREAGSDLAAPGTRVTLARPAASSDGGAFRAEVWAALRRYCRYLRRNDRSSSVLPVDLDGVEINEPLKAGGPVELRFREGAVEGAVGLADAPRVELYARGLPVWEGMLLEELSHNPPALQSGAGLETGLSPVFVLNGNDLRVVMDRNAVVDDKALRRLRRQAARALRRLVREQLDGLPDRGAFPRLRRLLSRLRYRQGGPVIAGVLVLGLLLGTFFLWEGRPRPDSGEDGQAVIGPWTGLPQGESALKSLPQGESAPTGLPREPRRALSDLAALQDALASYNGAVVEEAPGGDHLALTWTPAGRAWFRLSAAEDFDPARGFVRNPPPRGGDVPPPVECGEDCLRVRVPAARGGSLPLPMPTGWALVGGDLRIDDASPAPPPWLNGYGEAMVEIPVGGAQLSYSCAPHRRTLDPAARARLLFIEGADLPDSLEDALRDLEHLPPEARVRRALGLTRDLLRYVEGGGPRPALPMDSPWIRRVLDRGTGDCDVINGLMVLALRRLGIPARLAIGFVGDEGRLRPGLHAWTEFHLGGWQAVDASAPAAEVGSGAGEPLEMQPGAEVVGALPLAGRSVPPYPRPVLVAASPPLRPSAVRFAPSPPERGGSSTPNQTSVAAPTTATSVAIGNANDSPSRGEVPGTREASPRGRGRDAASGIFLIIAILSGLAALALLGVHLTRRHRRLSWRRLEGERSTEAMDRVLGRMALSWSVRPDLWGVAGFSLAPLLPRLAGGRISLERAIHLADHGRLFFGHPDNPLTASPRRGAVVLNGSNPGFAPFLHRIPGAMDLDAIHRGAPKDPAGGDGPVSSLLAAVNRVLDQLGETNTRCLIAAELGCGGLRDVDLGRIGRRGDLPSRFVAVDPGAPFLREATRVHAEQPALAIYRVVEWLSHRSALPGRSPAQLRRAAARRILEGST
ncbi:MAG: transglutaminase domain-containing protein [Pseudomonadota bacterium]